MPANLGLPDNPQRISFVCDCGKKLVTYSIKSGKRLRCSSCGQAVVAPVGEGTVPTRPRATSKPQTRAGNRRLKIALLSLTVVVAIGGGAAILFAAKHRQQARSGAANAEVKEADDGAAERAADAIFDAAKTKLNAAYFGRDIALQAIALLRQYVADPHATKKAEAQQLIAEYDLATSDEAALQTLMAMSDEQIGRFYITRVLHDNKITHPNLASLRVDTMERHFHTAFQRHTENRIAEENRQHEENLKKNQIAEAKKIAEAKRQESERLALAASQRADEAKLIGVRVVGSWLRWNWNDSGIRLITFAPNGVFAVTELGQGLWKVDDSGTIRLSFADRGVVAVVKMNLHEDRISIDNWSYAAPQQGTPRFSTASRIHDFGISPAATDLFIAQQIGIIKTQRDSIVRRQGADNLTALGRAKCSRAVAAVPELANSVVNDHDAEVQRKAIEAIGEIGLPNGNGIWYARDPAIIALSVTLVSAAPELAVAAEDALMKYLPTVGKRLSLDDARLLFELHASGNKRVAPVIEKALATLALAMEEVAKEQTKRQLQAVRDAEYWAKEDAKRRLAGLPTREEMLAGARARREEFGRDRSSPPVKPSVPWIPPKEKSENQKAYEFELARGRIQHGK
jgi:hypothetical protein